MVLDEHTALADAAAARDAGADLVEFRIDEFFSGSTGADGQIDERELRTILRIVAESPLPCIVTCRAAAESGGVGGYDGDDMARVSLYERLGTASSRSMLHAAGGAQGLREHPPRYIDVEYATYLRSANIKQKVNLAVDHPRQQRDVRTGLILSMHDNEQYFFEALRAGASGYVLKSVADLDLLKACRATLRGEPFVYPGAVTALIQDYLNRARHGDALPGTIVSSREEEVLKLIAEGLSSKEIARALTISLKTVERHRENILAKLGMRDRTQLTRYAIRAGLVEP